jgi:hypothetical protein
MLTLSSTKISVSLTRTDYQRLTAVVDCWYRPNPRFVLSSHHALPAPVPGSRYGCAVSNDDHLLLRPRASCTWIAILPPKPTRLRQMAHTVVAVAAEVEAFRTHLFAWGTGNGHDIDRTDPSGTLPIAPASALPISLGMCMHCTCRITSILSSSQDRRYRPRSPSIPDKSVGALGTRRPAGRDRRLSQMTACEFRLSM